MSTSGCRRRRRVNSSSSRKQAKTVVSKGDEGEGDDQASEQDFLGELSTRLKEVWLARVKEHVNFCCSWQHSCGLQQTKAAVDPRCWLAQGTYNIVLFPDAKTKDYVHRWSFLAYDNDTVADARVSWAKALRDAGIGASRDSQYQKISDAELKSFIKTFDDLKDRCLDTLERKCPADCKKDLEEQMKKVNQKTKTATVLMGYLKDESSRAFYLFRDKAQYAENDLQAWLKAQKTSKARHSAWQATYEVIQKYAELFVQRLASEPESDALVVDLQLGNFLVYESRSSSEGQLRVLLGDADMYEGPNNAPASELSLGSLELLSDKTFVVGAAAEVSKRLALGMMATLLANARPSLEEVNNHRAFEDGLAVLREELEELAASPLEQARLLSSAIALVANLHFQAQTEYYTFSELLKHYVEAKTKLVGYHEIQGGPVRRATFAQLHDLYQSSTAPTAAAEMYLDLLSKAFACAKCSRTKKKVWATYLEELEKIKNHSVPEWVQRCDIQRGLLIQLKNRNADPDSFRAEARDETLMFWKQPPGTRRRTDIATFGFVDSELYAKWIKIFWENRIGVGEVGSSVSIGKQKSKDDAIYKMLSVLKPEQKRKEDPKREEFAESASELLQRALDYSTNKGKALKLVCHTQSNNNGLLTDYLMVDSTVAGQAWGRVLLLMQKYARLLCRQADKGQPMCLLGRWDPSHVVVYLFKLGGQEVVKVRLLDTLLLGRQPLECSKRELVQQARALCAEATAEKTKPGLAALSYLTLLANGTEHIPPQVWLGAEQSRRQALAPLLSLLGSWEPEDWKRLLSNGPELAAKLEMASEHGLSQLERIKALCQEALELNEVLNAVWPYPAGNAS